MKDLLKFVVLLWYRHRDNAFGKEIEEYLLDITGAYALRVRHFTEGLSKDFVLEFREEFHRAETLGQLIDLIKNLAERYQGEDT